MGKILTDENIVRQHNYYALISFEKELFDKLLSWHQIHHSFYVKNYSIQY